MKSKKIFSFIVFIIVCIFFNICYTKAESLPQSIGTIKQVDGTYTLDKCGKVDDEGNPKCYGLALKVYGDTPVICTDYDNPTPAGVNSCTITSDWSEAIRYGVAAIIKQSKSGISSSSLTTEYFAAEMAINRFLYEKNIGGADIYGPTLSETYEIKYDSYLSAANTAYDNYSTDSAVSITLSDSALTFTLNGANYESNSVTVSGVDSFSVTTSVGDVSKTNNSFKIIVPASSLASSTTVTVTVSSSKSLDQARNYNCGSGYQTLTPVSLETVTKTDSKTLSGTITPVKATLTINKVDNSNVAISGATIKVTGTKGYNKTFVTNGQPIVISDLEFDTYTISETIAPSGYTLTEAKQITLSSSNLSGTVNLINTKNKVSISKLDVTGKKELPGATLEIQDEEGNIVKYCVDESGNSNAECKWVSTDKPYEIEGMPNGKYYLIETIAPSGYVLSKEKIEFEITSETSIKEVKMSNKLNKINIHKINSVDGKMLPGATLQIVEEDGNNVKYCTDEKGNKNTECKWVSTDKPYEIEGLPNGKYYLMEVVAPEGYELNTKKIEFVVDGIKEEINVEMENQLEVEVPSTLSSRSALLLAIAMFDIALGIGIVTYVQKNKIKEQ